METSTFTIKFLDKEYPVLYVNSLYKTIELLKKLLSKKCLFGFDTETMPLKKYRQFPKAGLSPHLATIRLIQLFDGEQIYIIDMFHFWDVPEVIAMLKEFFETKQFVAHNALFDLQFVRKHFQTKHMNIGCTYLLWKIITHASCPTDEGIRASLDVLVDKLLGENLLKTLQVSDWGYENLTFEQVQYAALDAIAVYKIAEKLLPTIINLDVHRYYKLCKAAQHPIAEMQLNGIEFDSKKHIELIDQWRSDLYKAKKDLVKLTGLTSITSHTIAHYFEKHLKPEVLAIWPRTEEGKLMCDAHTLLDFYSVDPLITPFAVYQKKEKLCTAFGINLVELINPETKRLHANYNLLGARTGRLSCSTPNLQQLPRDVSIRQNFRASADKVLVCADYSQIELRVGAEVSRDPAMLRAYREGIDLHTLTAATVGRKQTKDVSEDDRFKAKAFNFGLMFGLGPRKFSRYAKHSYDVTISNEEAKESIELWRGLYAGYREWQLAQAEYAQIHGVVTTPMGKVRALDRANCYGASMNTPVQGGAAECMLAALIGLQAALNEGGYTSKLCNCIHDEIIVECPQNEKEDVKDLVRQYMKEGFEFVFPDGITNGICKLGEGATWAEAKD